MIIRYLRDKKGRLKGCVVKDGDKYGYSLVHPLDKNRNSKNMARKIAIERAQKIIIEPIVETATLAMKVVYETKRISNGRRRTIPHTIVPYLKELMETPCPENAVEKL